MIEKVAYSIVLGVIILYGSLEYSDFEQYFVWLGLNSQFWRIHRSKFMITIPENLEFSIFQIAS